MDIENQIERAKQFCLDHSKVLFEHDTMLHSLLVKKIENLSPQRDFTYMQHRQNESIHSEVCVAFALGCMVNGVSMVVECLYEMNARDNCTRLYLMIKRMHDADLFKCIRVKKCNTYIQLYFTDDRSVEVKFKASRYVNLADMLRTDSIADLFTMANGEVLNLNTQYIASKLLERMSFNDSVEFVHYTNTLTDAERANLEENHALLQDFMAHHESGGGDGGSTDDQ